MARKRSCATRERLLSAAADVFMEKGYRDATVAEICRRADANVSAVNYYFGSKEALYQEAWRTSFEESLRAYPLDGGVSQDASAEECMRGQLSALVRRVSDRNNREFPISQMELANPTGLLREVMRVSLAPQRERTLSLVRELLGPRATEQQVRYCETCVISMCLNPLLTRRGGRIGDGPEVPPPAEDLGAFVEHVADFALAGIAAVRQGIQKQDGNAS